MTEFRPGTCSSCGAQYRVPATFRGDRARCQGCGGTVAIGPPTQDAPEPPPSGGPFAAPSAPVAESAQRPPAGAVPQVPARPVAPRAPAKPAAQAARPPSPPVPPRSLTKPAPTVPVPPPRPAPPAKPAPVPAEEAPRKKREGPSMKEQLLARRAAAQGTPPPAVREQRAERPKPEKVAAKPSAATSKAAAPAKPGPARARSGSASERSASARGRKRGGASPKGERKPNPALLLGSLAGLVVLAFVLWFFLLREGDDARQEALAQGPEASSTQLAEQASSQSEQGAQPESGREEENASAGAAEARAETEKPREPAKKAEPVADPSSVDLGSLAAFGPADGTSEEEWAEIRGLVELGFAAEDQGAPGNRARIKLEALGKPAVPALINAMLGFDYATETGKSQGDLAQRLLTKICNGRNFDWRYTTEPKDVLFNKKVVVAWHTQWNKAKDSEEYWLAMIKAKVPGAEAAAPEVPKERSAKEAELDLLDDL